MSGIFPIRSNTTISPPESAQVIPLDDAKAGDIIAALSSNTARAILTHLFTEACTPSDLADHTDTSLQNIRYHLDNLLDAGLVEIADTWYSETGNEMKVYAPSAAALVLFAGIETTQSNVQTAIKQALGAVGIIALGSLIVQLTAQALRSTSPNVSGGGTGAVGTSFLHTLPPGALFLAGGVLTVTVFLGWWYYKEIIQNDAAPK